MSEGVRDRPHSFSFVHYLLDRDRDLAAGRCVQAVRRTTRGCSTPSPRRQPQLATPPRTPPISAPSVAPESSVVSSPNPPAVRRTWLLWPSLLLTRRLQPCFSSTRTSSRNRPRENKGRADLLAMSKVDDQVTRGSGRGGSLKADVQGRAIRCGQAFKRRSAARCRRIRDPQAECPQGMLITEPRRDPHTTTRATASLSDDTRAQHPRHRTLQQHIEHGHRLGQDGSPMKRRRAKHLSAHIPWRLANQPPLSRGPTKCRPSSAHVSSAPATTSSSTPTTIRPFIQLPQAFSLPAMGKHKGASAERNKAAACHGVQRVH